MRNSTKAKQTATTTNTAKAASINLVSPRGKTHTVARAQIASFASRYNLDVSNLRKVANGTRSQHKGWVIG